MDNVPKNGRGESEWIALRSYTQWIRRHLHLLHIRAEHVLVLCMIHPDRMTSWVPYNDVCTGDGFLHFVSYEVLSNEDIHVWFPSQWPPARDYVLHLGTLKVLHSLLAGMVHFLTTGSWWNCCLLLLSDKARAKKKTYVRVSVRWKTNRTKAKTEEMFIMNR